MTIYGEHYVRAAAMMCTTAACLVAGYYVVGTTNKLGFIVAFTPTVLITLYFVYKEIKQMFARYRRIKL